MMNHEGKANRRFQRDVQVRIGCPSEGGSRNGGLSSAANFDFRLIRGFSLAKIRDKTFAGALM
jgi:hypothetical protein